MGDSRVEMSNDKVLEEKARRTEETGWGTIVLIISILVGATGLAASVYYPTATLVLEINRLVSHIENTTVSNNNNVADSVGLPKDCFDILQFGHSTSGVYKIFPGNIKRGIDVLCDMETDEGGWLVFQSRFDGSGDFFRPLIEYQYGFGNFSSEFWLGNEFIHFVTSQGLYELRVDMTDFENEARYAKYKLFHVNGRNDKFRLTIGGFTGDAGDSLTQHNGMAFSAKDADNDIAGGNCAQSFKGGFWYENCHYANPNGLYLSGPHETLAIGVNWQTWKGYKYSLKTIDMKIRPL